MLDERSGNETNKHGTQLYTTEESGAQTCTPGVIAELHTDPLRDAPLGGKDANALLLVVDKSAPQPGIASVNLV